MGDGALHQNTTGNNNIALGVEAGVNITAANHVICIGTAGANLNGSCFIGNIFGTTSGEELRSSSIQMDSLAR
ncbi:MAG TPA: hypothetical protein VJ372_02750 [Pyrinomonadaceae bacterium]|jgi:hypothetical protein|nr:hypothetical protein [Pyrinomonadaceae bacterium]